jgi:hypothetical protein
VSLGAVSTFDYLVWYLFEIVRIIQTKFFTSNDISYVRTFLLSAVDLTGVIVLCRHVRGATMLANPDNYPFLFENGEVTVTMSYESVKREF